MALLAIDHSCEADHDHVSSTPTLIILSDVEHGLAKETETIDEAAEAKRPSLFDRQKPGSHDGLPRVRPSTLRRRADGIDHDVVTRAERPSALRRSNLSGLGSIR